MFAVVALTIAGCVPAPVVAGGSPSPTSPTPTPTATLTPTPTPTLVPPTKPALADLRLTAEGLGPLVIGQAPPVTDPALDILVFEPEFCDGVWGDRGLWVPNYPETDAFHVIIDGAGLIRTIFPGSVSLLTDTEISVGSSRAELEAAYPGGFDDVISTPSRADVYVVEGASGQLIFEVSTASYDSDRVVLIRAALSDGTPPGPRWQTDGLGGGCPNGM